MFRFTFNSLSLQVNTVFVNTVGGVQGNVFSNEKFYLHYHRGTLTLLSEKYFLFII